jgi:hypothetical protein
LITHSTPKGPSASTLLAILSCALFPAASLADEPQPKETELIPAPAIEILDRRVISWKPPLYHGWPTLAKRSNGELLLAFSGGREAHVCPFGRLEWMRSKDNGQSWDWPQVILDSPNQARVSLDSGRTWSEPITISDDGHSGDLGYPSTVECDDGTLVTVWYEVLKDSPLAQLRQARWKFTK